MVGGRLGFVVWSEIEALAAFLMERWTERQVGRGLAPPLDLSGSCVFASLLSQRVFGGEIRGNEAHFHLRRPDGLVVDLCAWAADVEAIRCAGRDPHLHGRRLMRSRVVREQIASCAPRVDAWLPAWSARPC